MDVYNLSIYDKIFYQNWRWQQKQWSNYVVEVDKLYTPANIVVLRLLGPCRIISLGSNNTTGMTLVETNRG